MHYFNYSLGSSETLTELLHQTLSLPFLSYVGKELPMRKGKQIYQLDIYKNIGQISNINAFTS